MWPGLLGPGKRFDPQVNESEFGIIQPDQKPKPAYRAYQTLAKPRPPGSTPERTQWKTDGLYHQAWKRPDGVDVHARPRPVANVGTSHGQRAL